MQTGGIWGCECVYPVPVRATGLTSSVRKAEGVTDDIRATDIRASVDRTEYGSDAEDMLVDECWESLRNLTGKATALLTMTRRWEPLRSERYFPLLIPSCLARREGRRYLPDENQIRRVEVEEREDLGQTVWERPMAAPRNRKAEKRWERLRRSMSLKKGTRPAAPEVRMRVPSGCRQRPHEMEGLRGHVADALLVDPEGDRWFTDGSSKESFAQGVRTKAWGDNTTLQVAANLLHEFR